MIHSLCIYHDENGTKYHRVNPAKIPQNDLFGERKIETSWAKSVLRPILETGNASAIVYVRLINSWGKIKK